MAQDNEYCLGAVPAKGRKVIKAVLIGNLLLGIYTACLGYIGASTGLSTHLLARYSFGVKGSWLPSLLLGGTQVGWFGVGVAMFALPVQKATGIDVNWLIAISGVLMTVTVYFGISALMVLSFVAGATKQSHRVLHGADHGGRFLYQCRNLDRRLCSIWS